MTKLTEPMNHLLSFDDHSESKDSEDTKAKYPPPPQKPKVPYFDTPAH